MSKPIKSVPDPIFNDFIYSLLYNAPIQQKRELHGKYLKAAMSEKAAKTFIRTATDEDKKYLLSKLGMRFFWCFVADEFKPEWLRDILNRFNEDKKPQAFREILEKKFFIASDREFLKLLSVTASSIHHPSFFLDMEFIRQNWHIKKWKKRFFNPTDMQMREAQEGSDELCSLLFSASVTMDYMKSLMGMSPDAMKLLLYLYPNSHRKLSDSHLCDYFTGYMGMTTLRVAIKTLQKAGHIESDTGQKERSYTITGKGIRAVSEFFKTVFSKLNK